MVIRINKTGKHIEKIYTCKYYSQIGLGIDFTKRYSTKLRKKDFLGKKQKDLMVLAQISKTFINKTELNLNNISFKLEKNGEIVQTGNSKDMLFHFNKIISYISKFYT